MRYAKMFYTEGVENEIEIGYAKSAISELRALKNPSEDDKILLIVINKKLCEAQAGFVDSMLNR